ncbi:MAG: DUF2520 domain-containing protein [Paludibacteraceae bacterium]|nr:DUF2520 domain-containing protein [Paludibacteraceae bacterium]
MLRVVLIGAGNVATCIGRALCRQGHQPLAVYSRSQSSAQSLGQLLGCDWTTDKRALPAADLYLVSVKDDAIGDCLQGMSFGNGVLAHTAGSVDMRILEPYAKHIGVFYPLQTFSKSEEVDFTKITAYIEAKDNVSKNTLLSFATILQTKVREVDSARRGQLHLAAVFACNFANHMCTLAGDLLNEAGLPFEDLLPLIDETVGKLHRLPPVEAQTGPAVRGDQGVQQQHLAKLDQQKAEIYRLISESIYRHAQL